MDAVATAVICDANAIPSTVRFSQDGAGERRICFISAEWMAHWLLFGGV
jgi:hypothetical protein